MEWIFEIGSVAPPYIIFVIGIALVTLITGYAYHIIRSGAIISKWEKGIFNVFTWMLIFAFFFIGLFMTNTIYIMIRTPGWWQLLVKCFLILSLYSIAFIFSELMHYIKDVQD